MIIIAALGHKLTVTVGSGIKWVTVTVGDKVGQGTKVLIEFAAWLLIEVIAGHVGWAIVLNILVHYKNTGTTS